MRRPLALLALLLVAGCSDPAPEATPAARQPTVITDPSAGLNDTGAHIHDYWRGGDRLVVVDQTHPGGGEPGTGPGFAQGDAVVVRSFQPDSGDVVPQGTAAVEVTFSWSDADLDSYRDPTLWLKTAGTNATEQVAAVANGEPVTVEVGLPDADLPHQQLSAWLFELRMGSPDPMPLRFKGPVTLKVEAVRGLPLPVFPAHPDPWQGASELPLLSGGGELSYVQDLGDGGCNGLSCPTLHRPDSGAIVPHTARFVLVEVEASTPQAIELLYHGSSSREFTAAAPRVQGNVLAYEIAVPDAGGDGPYATQSQWEFRVVPAAAGPVRTAWVQQYTIEAKAVR